MPVGERARPPSGPTERGAFLSGRSSGFRGLTIVAAAVWVLPESSAVPPLQRGTPSEAVRDAEEPAHDRVAHGRGRAPASRRAQRAVLAAGRGHPDARLVQQRTGRLRPGYRIRRPAAPGLGPILGLVNPAHGLPSCPWVRTRTSSSRPSVAALDRGRASTPCSQGDESGGGDSTANPLPFERIDRVRARPRY